MTVNNTDTFLVERSGTSYKVEAQNLMADLQDADLMLVERSGTSYKATGLDIKDSLGSGLPNININDCFKTFGYTGNGSTQTFNVGFDCRASAGGCMIMLYASGAFNKRIYFFDTIRGAGKIGEWNHYATDNNDSNAVTSFTSTGFTIGSSSNVNVNGRKYKAHVFKVHTGFFDMVDYTGDGTNGRSISHNLGAIPRIIHSRNLAANYQQVYTYMEPGTINAGLEGGSDRGIQTRVGLYPDYPTDTTVKVNSYYNNRNGNDHILYLFGGSNNDDYPVKIGTYYGMSPNTSTGTLKFKTGGTRAQLLFIAPFMSSTGSNTAGWIIDQEAVDNPGDFGWSSSWNWFNGYKGVPSGTFTFGTDTISFSQTTWYNFQTIPYFYYVIGEP